MVTIGPEAFLRALAYARAAHRLRPRETVFALLTARLGELIFLDAARRVLPKTYVSDLNWIAMPAHLGPADIDVRVRGWKIDVKTSTVATYLDRAASNRADLVVKAQLGAAVTKELAARYRWPKGSAPIGLVDDLVPEVNGDVTGWIGIGSAEELDATRNGKVRIDDMLAGRESLWSLLRRDPGPNILRAHADWQKDQDTRPTPKQPRRTATSEPAVLLPPRRTARAVRAA